MWTPDAIWQEDREALSTLTDAQRAAIERMTLARNMAHFTADTFERRLLQQCAIEAENRNAREEAEAVASRRAGLKLVEGG